EGGLQPEAGRDQRPRADGLRVSPDPRGGAPGGPGGGAGRGNPQRHRGAAAGGEAVPAHPGVARRAAQQGGRGDPARAVTALEERQEAARAATGCGVPGERLTAVSLAHAGETVSAFAWLKLRSEGEPFRRPLAFRFAARERD